MSRPRQRGAALVKATLTLPLFLVLTLGLFDIAFVLHVEQTLAHNARAAARYGAINAYKSDTELIPEVRNIVLCGDPSPCSGYFGITPGQIAVACAGSEMAPPGHSCQLSSPDAHITIDVPGISYIPFAPYVTSLASRNIQVSLPIENSAGFVPGT
jgi:hypothetical protein